MAMNMGNMELDMQLKNSSAIMQPTFMPWVGYFDLINSVDKFVFLDDVQLTKRSWQVRNKVKTSNGEHFVTIPIEKTKHRNEITINEAKINQTDWKEKFLKVVQYNYKKSKYYDFIYPFLLELLQFNSNILSSFNINMIVSISEKLNIKTEFIKSSDLQNIHGVKDGRLVNICKSIDSNFYLSPQGSATYIESVNPGGEFALNNIELFYHNYEPVEYNQLYGQFLPYMGIFDLLFNEGFESSKSIILAGHKESIYYKEYKRGI